MEQTIKRQFFCRNSQSSAELAPAIHYFEKKYIGLEDPEDENCHVLFQNVLQAIGIVGNGSKKVYLGQIIAWRLGISLFRKMLDHIQISLKPTVY
ncbi:hypothetical protein BpHYR1_049373 [Brachionus plicatilis]|uniref:Uncharacterized protein n=1 Tax=Brachionus plicatilis TaxID=10195 RepID=A0A3M7SRI5_BRAPC|nr:hypothetical protein BpHYR1_049373 [Brachionus plicatilis]